MEELLQSWGVEDTIIQRFEENDITISNLKELTDEMIKELIPSVGKRLHFLQRFAEFKIMDAVVVFNDETEVNDRSVSDLSGTSTSNSEIFTLEQLPGTSKELNENGNYMVVPMENREVSFLGLKELFNNRPFFPEFDLLTLLQTSPLGKNILDYFNTNNSLNNKNRTILVDIIIKHLYNYIVKHRLKHDDYNVLTAKIMSLFPSEVTATYYIPSISKTMSNKGKTIVARGRLVDKCRNILHKCGDTIIYRKRKCSDDPAPAMASNKKTKIVPTDKLEEVTWLKYNSEPWAEVLEKLKSTFEYRRNADMNKNTVDNFLLQWPIFKDQRADQLINLDFEALHPGCELKLFEHWDIFVQTILSYKADAAKSSEACEVLKNDTNLSENSKVCYQIYALCQVIPPKGRIKVEKKHWKFSTLECIEGILVLSTSAAEIDEKVNLQKEKARIRRQSVQPYLLVEGPSLKEVNNIYLVIDTVKYHFKDTLKALDVLFKVFFVFNAEYPVQSAHIWNLIQVGIFGIESTEVFPSYMDVFNVCMNYQKQLKTFSLPKQFLIHLEYAHKVYNNFLCPFKNCRRSFQRKDVFRTHLNKQHLNEIKISDVSTCHLTDRDPNQTYQIPEESCNLGCNDLPPTCELDNFGSSLHNYELPSASELAEELKLLEHHLHKSLQDFVTKLHSNISLTRSITQEIIENVNLLISPEVINIMIKLTTVLRKYDDMIPLASTLTNVFKMLEAPFKFFDLETEYKRLNRKNNNISTNFLVPEQQIVGVACDESRRQNQTSLVLKNRLTSFIPMRENLRLFLELPQVLNTILEYQRASNAFDKPLQLTCPLDGGLWKKMCQKNPQKEFLPLILYFDDFETCNPLGSHSGLYKLGAVYYTIASIPPEYASRLENIFLALLFHSSDRSKYGNRIIFNPIITELKYLEENGITIDLGNGHVSQIYFKLFVITGDNLGLHAMFGLVESFSAHYFCRFCNSSKTETQGQTKIDILNLKNVVDYNNHLEHRSFGVKELCIWHEVEDFHIYENMVCDIMHDLFEGVHRYDMALIISDLLQKKYFSLDTLNIRIKYCPSHYSERNKLPGIKSDHLVNGSIICSASEMLWLVTKFRFIVGDLVPEDDEVWIFYLKLLNITDILISSSISAETLDLLNTLITEHHQMYISLFKTSLKPKHHFLLHYPKILAQTGPLSHTSCMRFEAFHKNLKSNAKNVNSRVNLPYTLSYKMQLKVSHRIYNKIGLENIVKTGKHINFPDNFLLETNTILDTLNKYNCFSWYEINGMRYSILDVVLLEWIDEMPQMGQIKYILLHKDTSECMFVCDPLTTINFSLHYLAYKIERSGQKAIVFSINDLCTCVPTVLHTLPDGDFYISLSKMF